MQLALTGDEIAFRNHLRSLYRNEIPPEIRDGVREGRELSREALVTTQRILDANRIAVPNWPQQWGGRDWTPIQRHLWHDEMALASVPEPLTFNVDMIGPVIARFGTEQQKARFLPPTANLDIWWCQGFSEPEAGSDLASLRTTATRDGNDYVVNGQKIWTSMAQYADWMFCLVRTDPGAAKKQAGISLLLIPMDAAGVTVRPIELIGGSREVNEVFLDDVRVPAEHLVGQENQGWTYAKYLLGNERTGMAAIGRTKVRLSTIKARARLTRVGKGTLLDDPLFAARLTELENDTLALELIQIGAIAGAKEDRTAQTASILKLRGSQLQQAATELMMEVAGPSALLSDHNRWAGRSTAAYLNCRKTSIYGGSTEVQRGIIASTILGL
ncbi:acyl-CoA dehydrogenase family protein [Nocardia sp. XZ_19_231]|uniref:acyl-CoA dehydrogenase family protein n=1 Tax=Nocardia sp. XZ_19_231 TaxID=2769252 RepID=UPI00189087F1|nr:acyl-CoA dehydrogenase family protein [Nocardia sp. XZ_19_231]